MGKAHDLMIMAMWMAMWTAPFWLYGQHQSIVEHLASSRDHQYLASFSADGELKIWERSANAVVTEWSVPGTDICDMAFHPSINRLITAEGNKIVVWDFESGKPLKKIVVSDNSLKAFAFDNTGKMLATADGTGKVLVWDFAGEAVVAELGMKEDRGIAIHTLAFSEDDNFLFTGREDGFIDQWYWRKEKIIYRYGESGKPVNKIALSRDGEFLAVNIAHENLAIWNTSSGKLHATLEKEGEIIRDIAFANAANDLLIGGYSGTIDPRLPAGNSPARGFLASWNTKESNYHWHWELETAVSGFAVNPGMDEVAMVGDNPGISIWNLSEGVFSKGLGNFPNTIGTMAIHPKTGLLLLGGEDSQLKVADGLSGRLVAVLPPMATGRITAIGQDMDNDVLITAHGSVLQVWQTDEQLSWFDPVHQIDLEDGIVEKIFFTYDRDEIMVVKRKRHVAFDAGHFAAVDPGYDHNFAAERLEPDPSTAAQIEIWNYSTGEKTGSISEYNGFGYEVQYNRETGLLICANRYHEVVHINWEKSTILGDFPMHKQAVTVGAFSPDKHIFVSGGYDQVIWVWNLDDMQVKEVAGMGKPVLTACIDPRNRILATSSASTIRVTHLDEGHTIATIPTGEPVRNLSFSVDGTHLFGTGINGEVIAWQTGTWTEIWRMSIMDRSDYVTIDPEGQYFGTLAGMTEQGLSPALALETTDEPRIEGAIFEFVDSGERTPDFEEEPRAVAVALTTHLPLFEEEDPDLPGEETPEELDQPVMEETQELDVADNQLAEQLSEYIFSGNFSKAETLATEILYEDAEDQDTRVLLTIAYLYRGKFDKARMIWYRYKNAQLLSGQSFSESLTANLHFLTEQGIRHHDTGRFLRVIAPVVERSVIDQ